jgi:transposase
MPVREALAPKKACRMLLRPPKHRIYSGTLCAGSKRDSASRKAIAQAHVMTDKIDAGTLASLQAAGYPPQIWTPDPGTERKRRLVARRYEVVRHRTRLKNEVHSILHAHLIPKCPHADLFNARGRAWLAAQTVAGR